MSLAGSFPPGTWWPSTLPPLLPRPDGPSPWADDPNSTAELPEAYDQHLKQLALDIWAAQPVSDCLDGTTVPQVYSAVRDALGTLGSPTILAKLASTSSLAWRLDPLHLASHGLVSESDAKRIAEAGEAPLGLGRTPPSREGPTTTPKSRSAQRSTWSTRWGWPVGFGTSSGADSGTVTPGSQRPRTSTEQGPGQESPESEDWQLCLLGEGEQERIMRRSVAVKILSHALQLSQRRARPKPNKSHTECHDDGVHVGPAAAAPAVVVTSDLPEDKPASKPSVSPAPLKSTSEEHERPSVMHLASLALSGVGDLSLPTRPASTASSSNLGPRSVSASGSLAPPTDSNRRPSPSPSPTPSTSLGPTVTAQPRPSPSRAQAQLEALAALGIGARKSGAQDRRSQGRLAAQKTPSPDGQVTLTLTPSEAEHLTIERAERAFAARIVESCESATRVCVVRIQVEVYVGDTWVPSSHLDRPGPTTSEEMKEDNPARVSWKPDLKPPKDQSEWEPDLFGRPYPTTQVPDRTSHSFGLGHDHAKERDQAGDPVLADQPIQMVGGTFVVHARSRVEARRVVDMLRILVYAGQAMLLETSFLVDAGVELSPSAWGTTTKPTPADTSVTNPPDRDTSKDGWAQHLWTLLSSAVHPAHASPTTTPSTRPKDTPMRHSKRALLPDRPRVSHFASTLSVSRLAGLGPSTKPGSVSRFFRSFWHTDDPFRSRMPSPPGVPSHRPSFGRARTLSIRQPHRFHRSGSDSRVITPHESFESGHPPLERHVSEPSAVHSVLWSRPDRTSVPTSGLTNALSTSPFVFRTISPEFDLSFPRAFIANQGISLIVSTPLPARVPLPIQMDALITRTYGPGSTTTLASHPTSVSNSPSRSYSPSPRSARRVTSLTVAPETARCPPVAGGTAARCVSTPLPSDTSTSRPELDASQPPSLVLGDDARWVNLCFFRSAQEAGDAQLGQVLETLALAATAPGSSTDTGRPESPLGERNSGMYGEKTRVVLVHNGLLVNVSARALRSRRPHKEDMLSSQPSQSSLASLGRASTTGSILTSSSTSPEVQQAPQGTASAGNEDISTSSPEARAVAELLHVGLEPARQALRLADTLVRHAKRKAEQAAGIELDPATPDKEGDLAGPIAFWSVARTSGASSEVRYLSAGSYLWSFGRFIETLLYHRALPGPEQRPNDSNGLPPMYFFRMGLALVQVATLPFRLYTLQLHGPVLPPEVDEERYEEPSTGTPNAEARRTLEEEINAFYSSVQHYLDKVALAVAQQAERARTPADSKDPTSPRARLYDLRQLFAQNQDTLLDLARSTSSKHLNDARVALHDHAKATSSRIEAWIAKHLPKSSLAKPSYAWPDYVQGEQMVLPSSSIIVHPERPLSVIAHVLSTPSFKQAVQAQLAEEDGSVQHKSRAESLTPSAAASDTTSVLSSSVGSLDEKEELNDSEQAPPSLSTALRAKSSDMDRVVGSPAPAPDPDDPEAVFYRAKEAKAWVKGKKRYKDLSLLAFNRLRRLSSRQAEDEERKPGDEKSAWPRPRPSMGSNVGSSSSTPRHATFRPTPSASIYNTPEEAVSEAELDTTQGAPPVQIPGVPPPHESGSKIDSSHVKYKYVRGQTKVALTAWYAAAFAQLRSLWGLDDEHLVDSLAHCATWATGGGKSSSAFYKTQDGHFVGKQLMTVWTSDETEAFLDFAPHYLRYATHCARTGQSSLLVRIVGVYSIEVHDPHAQVPKKHMNIMILENLFAPSLSSNTLQPEQDTHLVRFDLKGIRDRRVKSANYVSDPTARVWHDAEWMEHIKPSMLVPQGQKDQFLETLARDVEFLTKLDRMDYSLLVAVFTAPEPVLRVQLVDYLGAFTLAKQLESSSKRALKTHDGKHSVTILPPAEYAERLQYALRDYFVACPSDQALTARPKAGEDPLPAVL